MPSTTHIRLTGVIATGLAALASVVVPQMSHATAQPAIAPAGNGSVELTWIPAYMANKATSYTQAQAVQMAKTNNLVVGVPNAFGKYAADMRAANSHLTLLTYTNATFLPPGMASGVPEAEFAHNASGNRITSNNFGNYLMEPSNAAWRQRALNQCAQVAQQSNSDGCLLDMLTMAVFSKGYTSSMPIDPSTHTTYAEKDWQQQLIRFSQQYTNNESDLVIAGNAVSNASRYWNSQVPSRPIAMALPSAQTEDFLRGSGDAVTKYPTAASWLQNVHVITDMESSGRTGLYTTKVWVSATSTQVAAWQRYAMATFLMGANGHSFFNFTDARTPTGAMGTDLPYRMPTNLGAPSGAMTQSGNVYERGFSNGLSVVNPGDTTEQVSFSKQYRDLEGDSVSKLTLPPHSGDVLVGQSTSTSPTPTPTPTPTHTSTPTPTPTPTDTSTPDPLPTGLPTGVPTGPTPDQPTPLPTSVPTLGSTTASVSSSLGSAQVTVTPAAREKVNLAGQAEAARGIRHGFVAVQRLSSGKWLHANGHFGHYRRIPVTLHHRHARSTKWSVVLRLPAGHYRAQTIVKDRRGRANAAPRPWVKFSVRTTKVGRRDHHHGARSKRDLRARAALSGTWL